MRLSPPVDDDTHLNIDFCRHRRQLSNAVGHHSETARDASSRRALLVQGRPIDQMGHGNTARIGAVLRYALYGRCLRPIAALIAPPEPR